MRQWPMELAMNSSLVVLSGWESLTPLRQDSNPLQTKEALTFKMPGLCFLFYSVLLKILFFTNCFFAMQMLILYSPTLYGWKANSFGRKGGTPDVQILAGSGIDPGAHVIGRQRSCQLHLSSVYSFNWVDYLSNIKKVNVIRTG